MKKNDYYWVNKEIKNLNVGGGANSQQNSLDDVFMEYESENTLTPFISTITESISDHASTSVLSQSSEESENSECDLDGSFSASDVSEQFDSFQINNILTDVTEWAVQNNVTSKTTNALLRVLKKIPPKSSHNSYNTHKSEQKEC